MICGSDEIVDVCRDRIAPSPHQVSADGKYSWEEVECLGACANAPMVQIGKDFYEDLTSGSFSAILDSLEEGAAPTPGPQNGRFSCEPLSGPSTLADPDQGSLSETVNASVSLAAASPGNAESGMPPESGEGLS